MLQSYGKIFSSGVERCMEHLLKSTLLLWREKDFF
jgi:hypothetical protein